MASVSVSTPILVDPRFAYNAAIESTPSLIHSLLEDFSNCKDYGNDIKISLYGDMLQEKGRVMRLRKVVFEDDGCGMSHDTVCERFRGSYFDSASHQTSEKSGRNGVGVKTNFKYWGTIEVETTTSDIIPKWKCHDDNLAGIEDSWNAMTRLKTGDPDTEKRFYKVTRSDMKFEKTVKVPEIEHGTKVTLKDPIGKVKLDLDEFIRRLGQSIEFLDGNRHPDHRVSLAYPNSSGNMTSMRIKPFHKVTTIGNVICEAVRHPSSKDDKNNIIWVTGENQTPISVPGPDPKILGDVEVFIKVLENAESANNQFVMSICGSNVYNGTGSEGKPYALIKACHEHSMTSVVSFLGRIFGYVRTNDPRLKQALRLNRTALDDDDPVVQEFFTYLGNILKALNKQFVKYMEMDNDIEDENTLSAIQEKLNMTLSSPKGEKTETGTGEPSKEPEHHWWVCLDCEREWKVPTNQQPLSCCEFDVKGQSGCYGGRVERKKNELSSNLMVKWVPYIGGFVSARYDEAENIVELAKYHPDFILVSGSRAAKNERIMRGVERALFSVACHRGGGRDVELQYAELLRKRFKKASNKAQQRACRKFWKENDVDSALI